MIVDGRYFFLLCFLRLALFQSCTCHGVMRFFSSLALCGDLDLECQKLVELISAVQTSKDTLDRSRAFAEACGKGIRFFLLVAVLCCG